MSVSRESIERGVRLSSRKAEQIMMDKIRQDYSDAVAARLARKASVPPYQLEIKGQDLNPTLMALRGRQPLSDPDAISQGVSVGSYPSRPLSAAPDQLSILDILQRQALEGRIDPADIKRTIRTEKEIDRRLAAEAIIRELGLEARAEPIIAELIQGPKATSTGQRLAAMQPAMNNIRPAQILALLAATGLGGGVTAALLDQGNQQQQQQPAMAAQ